jgi:hypothetical protein
MLISYLLNLHGQVTVTHPNAVYWPSIAGSDCDRSDEVAAVRSTVLGSMLTQTHLPFRAGLDATRNCVARFYARPQALKRARASPAPYRMQSTPDMIHPSPDAWHPGQIITMNVSAS